LFDPMGVLVTLPACSTYDGVLSPQLENEKWKLTNDKCSS